MHAGEIETSILLHAAPELVRDGYADSDPDGGTRPFLLVHGTATTRRRCDRFTSLASADNGKAVLDSLRESFADHLGVLCASD
jgi:creatinine amidohydrolase